MRRIGPSVAAFCTGVLAAAGAVQAAEIAGAVDANGRPQIASTMYRVTHPSIGRYIIHFTHAFPPPHATCIYMPVGDFRVKGLTETTETCDVAFINQFGGLANAIFNFVAVDTTN